MLYKNWWFFSLLEGILEFFCLYCKIANNCLVINEIQPKRKFWNIVQWPFNNHYVLSCQNMKRWFFFCGIWRSRLVRDLFCWYNSFPVKMAKVSSNLMMVTTFSPKTPCFCWYFPQWRILMMNDKLNLTEAFGASSNPFSQLLSRQKSAQHQTRWSGLPTVFSSFFYMLRL